MDQQLHADCHSVCAAEQGMRAWHPLSSRRPVSAAPVAAGGVCLVAHLQLRIAPLGRMLPMTSGMNAVLCSLSIAWASAAVLWHDWKAASYWTAPMAASMPCAHQ